MKGGLVGRKRSACLAAVAVVASALLGEELRQLGKCEFEHRQSGQPMAGLVSQTNGCCRRSASPVRSGILLALRFGGFSTRRLAKKIDGRIGVC
jgi:hypothetical protein